MRILIEIATALFSRYLMPVCLKVQNIHRTMASSSTAKGASYPYIPRYGSGSALGGNCSDSEGNRINNAGARNDLLNACYKISEISNSTIATLQKNYLELPDKVLVCATNLEF